MDPGPLVTEQVEAGARFLGEFRKYLPVQSAFWLKDGEEGAWFLYIASDRITDDNFDVAYGEVLRIAGRLQDPSFDPFLVKLIGADDPLARAVADARRHYPGRAPTRLQGMTLGGTTVEDIYIYPAPAAAPVP